MDVVDVVDEVGEEDWWLYLPLEATLTPRPTDRPDNIQRRECTHYNYTHNYDFIATHK